MIIMQSKCHAFSVIVPHWNGWSCDQAQPSNSNAFSHKKLDEFDEMCGQSVKNNCNAPSKIKTIFLATLDISQPSISSKSSIIITIVNNRKVSVNISPKYLSYCVVHMCYTYMSSSESCLKLEFLDSLLMASRGDADISLTLRRQYWSTLKVLSPK